MNMICKLFGHNFIGTIVTHNWWGGCSYLHHLKGPMCKRCGLTKTEIRYLISKKKS